jgi:hypothetical protein
VRDAFTIAVCFLFLAIVSCVSMAIIRGIQWLYDRYDLRAWLDTRRARKEVAMPADTPAPSPSPESSALDALLRNTDAVSEPTETWAAYTAAPHLAAIVRALRDGMTNINGESSWPGEDGLWKAKLRAHAALARAEAIAKSIK